MHCKFCGDDKTYGTHCKMCGSQDVMWLRDNGRFILTNKDGTQHGGRYGSCSRVGMTTKVEDIITTKQVSGNRHKSDLADEIHQQIVSQAGSIAADMVNTVRQAAQSEEHRLEGVVNNAYGLIGAYTQTAKQDAIAELKVLLPVKHEIHTHNNGQIKVIDGIPHYKLGLLTHVLNQRIHVTMVGPAGGGKTTAASQVAGCLGLPYYEEPVGPATSAWDLKGFLNVVGAYVAGILREPFENGGVLMLDEIDAANPAVLTTFNSALSNEYYTFPGGDRVKRHPDFICVAGANTYGQGADRVYVGRNQLDGATLDRFAVIDWDYDEQAELHWAAGVNVEHDMLDWECTNCTCSDSKWVEYVQKVRHYVESQSMRVIISPRASIYGVRLLEAGIKANLVADMVLWKGVSSDDRQRTISSVGEYRS